MSGYHPDLPHFSKMTGHALKREGKAYAPTEHGWEATSSALGVGLCQCGDRSPVCTSDRQRKKWHKNHKDALYAKGHR